MIVIIGSSRLCHDRLIINCSFCSSVDTAINRFINIASYRSVEKIL